MNDIQERPLVTLALFSYNQERFIGEALDAALAQDYEPLEIIVSDDCSSDRTFDVIETILASYKGRAKVLINRNNENLGFAENINKVMSLAGGGLIVAAAGDDVSSPSRVRELVELWASNGYKAVSIFSSMQEIDHESQATGKIFRSTRNWKSTTPLNILKENISVFGAAHAWSRAVAIAFPPLHSRLINEDAAIPFRSALLDGIIYSDKALVSYRANLGMASNYGNGSQPSRQAQRSPSLLLRPYLVYVQECADIKFAGKSKELIVLASHRRADHLFRYWLAAGRRFTWRRILLFAKRCRFSWVVRELFLHLRY